MNIPTREQLTKRRGIVIADAQMKFEIADWHGVADAMMDLREIDAQIALFDQLREYENLLALDHPDYHKRLVAVPVGTTGIAIHVR